MVTAFAHPDHGQDVLAFTDQGHRRAHSVDIDFEVMGRHRQEKHDLSMFALRVDLDFDGAFVPISARLQLDLYFLTKEVIGREIILGINRRWLGRHIELVKEERLRFDVESEFLLMRAGVKQFSPAHAVELPARAGIDFS